MYSIASLKYRARKLAREGNTVGLRILLHILETRIGAREFDAFCEQIGA